MVKGVTVMDEPLDGIEYWWHKQELKEVYEEPNSLNSKDLRGACAKVPKPPRRAGLIKS